MTNTSNVSMTDARKNLDIPKAIQDLLELSEYLLDRVHAGEWVNAWDLDQERLERLGDLFRHFSAEELSPFFWTLQRLRDIDSRVLGATRLAQQKYANHAQSIHQLKQQYHAYARSEPQRR